MQEQQYPAFTLSFFTNVPEFSELLDLFPDFAG
jgi:hypothetical protein